METYDASVKLPDVLRNTTDPNTPLRLAFQEGMQTKQTYFEWLEEKVPQPDGTLGPRPNLEIFSLAMLGGGRVLTTPMNYGKSGCYIPPRTLYNKRYEQTSRGRV